MIGHGKRDESLGDTWAAMDPALSASEALRQSCIGDHDEQRESS
jgi:hypothetical protein